MVRYVTRQSQFRVANLITAISAVLTIGVFVAIIAWPSGPSRPIDESVLLPTPLSNALNDDITHAFLATLHRVEPKTSRQLHAEAEQALDAGASPDELAFMVVTAYAADQSTGFDAFIKADVKYFEKMLRMSQNGLSSLALRKSKYCQLASIESLNQQAPDEVVEDMRGMLAYNSAAYQWILRFSVLQLLAIEDGRTNPKAYKRMTAEDERALQAMFMRLMNSRTFAELMSPQLASESEQRRALHAMNLCQVGAEFLAAVNDLPSDTKSRLLIELKHLQRAGAIKELVRARFGNSCAVCSVL